MLAPLLVVLSFMGADDRVEGWKPVFTLPSAGGGPLLAIWADERGSIVAVGREVIVQGKRTGAFQSTPLPPTHGLFGVWGRRADDVFAVGPRRERIDEPWNKTCRSGADQRGVTIDGYEWVRCKDRSVLLKEGETFVARGRAPTACTRSGPSMHGSAIWKGDLFLNCGDGAWRNHGTQWELEPTPGKVRAFFATSACLYAVTDRSVLARC